MITEQSTTRVLVRCDACLEAHTIIEDAIDRVAVYLVLMRRGWTLDGPFDFCWHCALHATAAKPAHAT